MAKYITCVTQADHDEVVTQLAAVTHNLASERDNHDQTKGELLRAQNKIHDLEGRLHTVHLDHAITTKTLATAQDRIAELQLAARP